MKGGCMKIPKNESNTDRAVRIVIGIVVLSLALLKLTGAAQVVAVIVGAIALITGLVGFCALYSLLGINTLKK
jgi:hypothetical protein